MRLESNFSREPYFTPFQGIRASQEEGHLYAGAVKRMGNARGNVKSASGEQGAMRRNRRKKEARRRLRSFPPVADGRARVLIVGTMPGEASLAQREYYAHPHNAFWYIMDKLFGAGRRRPYRERLALLRRRGVAVWDVIARCRRAGSLDENIERHSVVPNDFPGLFSRCPGIRAVFFNGQNAARLYRRWVWPRLPPRFRALPTYILPSTSPAAARLRPGQKLRRWRRLLNWLDDRGRVERAGG